MSMVRAAPNHPSTRVVDLPDPTRVRFTRCQIFRPEHLPRDDGPDAVHPSSPQQRP